MSTHTHHTRIIATLAFLTTTLAFGTAAVAAKKLCKDGTPPPCKPGGVGEAASNNLSFPAIVSDNVYPTGWLVVTS
jgi:hypothetical protein